MDYVIYGAYGYTGELIAREAVAQGHEPLLAGRNESKLERLAGELGLPSRAVSLTDGFRLRSLLAEAPAVIHCAGPFSQTALPMVEACLDSGTHYLDITGEIDIFEALQARDDDAIAADVMLLPGIGFDVAPTDCLANALADQVTDPTDLEIAIMGIGGVSRGTLKTVVEQAGQGGLVRRGGSLVHVPSGWSTRTVDFGDHPRTVISIPWGDVVTAGYSTGIPNITVYTYLPRLGRQLLRLSRYVEGLFEWEPVQTLLKQLIDHLVPNPSAETRRKGRMMVWASIRDGEGQTRTARIWGPEAYTFTARTAVGAAEEVMGGTAPVGYQTPATAFGSAFALNLEGVERDLPSGDTGDE